MVDGHIEPDEACAITEEKFIELHRHELLAGDIVMARRGELGRAAMVTEVAEGWLCGTGSLRVRLDKSKADPRFVFWAMRTKQVSDWLSLESVGTTMENMSGESLSGLPIMLPPLPTQRAIVAYLDRETARLDELVKAKAGLLELLAEKRRALITHAVSRGLDPRAPLRDSGIPWLGSIPKHWDVKRLKHVTTKMEQGWSPQCDSMAAGDGEWGVMKAGCVNGPVLNENENKRLPDTEKPIPELEIRAGDILMSRANTTELLGSCVFVEAVRPKLILCDKLYRFHADSSVASGHFLVHFLSSPPGRFVMERDASGASNSMQNIGQEVVKNLFVPVPPLPEQKAIVAHLQRETAKLDALAASAAHTMTLLKERRAALISAAVTGKIAISEPSA